MDRLILHSDLNNFYASVECLYRPEYAHLPLAVAGNPERRHGVILAKNAIAKAAGVKTGDVIWEAKQKCAGLIIVPPQFGLYTDYSRRVFDIYTRFTPFVEPFGPDECWLDASGCEKLFGNGCEIAQKILESVKAETGLTVSVGVSFSKPLAKLCSDLAEPNGYYEASKSDFKKKLWSLPVSELMMVGRKTAEKLKTLSVNTIGDLANANEALLRSTLGINGIKLRQAALGIDDEPVRQYDKARKQESVGHGMTATRDITSDDDMYAMVLYLSEKIAVRLMKNSFQGLGIHIDLRSFELKHASRQIKLDRPVFSSSDIAEEAYSLIKVVWAENRVPVRSVSISVFDLSPIGSGVQLSFFEKKTDKREKLERAVESIRQKYGRDAVQRAALIERDFIYDKNDDEDFLPFKR